MSVAAPPMFQCTWLAPSSTSTRVVSPLNVYPKRGASCQSAKALGAAERTITASATTLSARATVGASGKEPQEEAREDGFRHIARRQIEG